MQTLVTAKEAVKHEAEKIEAIQMLGTDHMKIELVRSTSQFAAVFPHLG